MRRKPIILFPIALLLLLIIACESRRSADFGDVSEEFSESSDVEETAVNQAAVDRKLVKTGFITFETADLSATQQTIAQALTTYRAYASLDQTETYSGRVSNTLIVRVPAENFDQLVAAISKNVKEFDRKEIETLDVTEEFIDMQARLDTKKALEKRYLDLLRKAQKVSDILEIERQAGELRADIEAIEGRLRYLKSQVAYATLTVTFYEEVPTATGFGQQFANGFRNGWENLAWFFVALVNVWPFLLIIAGTVIGVRVWRRRKV